MTYGELSESQARRSKQFAEAQTNAIIAYCDAERDLKELHTENAKLREMVRDMWHTAMANMDFAERYAFAGEFNERMRELGIEVG